MIWILMLVICVGCVFGNSHNETYKLDVNHRVTYRGRERLKLAVQCPVGQLLDSVNLTNTSTNYVLNWFKNDRKLNPFTARRLRFDPDGLRIDATARLGSVRFYCELITGSGIALKSANLTLQYIDDMEGDYSDDEMDRYPDIDVNSIEPEFALDPEPVRQFYRVEGERVEFNCAANGEPRPEVLWFKNNHVISEEDLGIVRNSMILRLDALVLGDTGTYLCSFFNRFGEFNRTFNLQVIEKNTMSRRASRGDMIMLECPLSGSNIQWYSNNTVDITDDFISVGNESYGRIKAITPNIDQPNLLNVNFQNRLLHLKQSMMVGSNFQQLNDGSLVILNVTDVHKAAYICKNHNQAISNRIELTVEPVEIVLVSTDAGSNLMQRLNVSSLIVLLILTGVSVTLFFILKCILKRCTELKNISGEMSVSSEPTTVCKDVGPINRSTVNCRDQQAFYYQRPPPPTYQLYQTHHHHQLPLQHQPNHYTSSPNDYDYFKSRRVYGPAPLANYENVFLSNGSHAGNYNVVYYPSSTTTCGIVNELNSVGANSFQQCPIVYQSTRSNNSSSAKSAHRNSIALA